jgi:hypothetical protein
MVAATGGFVRFPAVYAAMRRQILAIPRRLRAPLPQSLRASTLCGILLCIGKGSVGIIADLAFHEWVEGSGGSEGRSVRDSILCSSIELTIRPLLCDSFAWSYQTILVAMVMLILLACTRSGHEAASVPVLVSRLRQLNTSQRPSSSEDELVVPLLDRLAGREKVRGTNEPDTGTVGCAE